MADDDRGYECLAEDMHADSVSPVEPETTPHPAAHRPLSGEATAP
ncbi:MAG TPA: hypothetical protein VGN37_08055 [Actinocatenispora sp.]